MPLPLRADLSGNPTNAKFNAAIGALYDYIDQLVALKSSTLEGYGITDAYTKTASDDITNLLATKDNPVFTGILTTAGQIKFPAAQNPSSDPNTLDDYEEGTWTPTLVTGGGGENLAYNSRNGRYTKIGRSVMAWFEIELTAVSPGSALRALLPVSLPFVPSSLAIAGGSMTTSAGLLTRNGSSNTEHCLVFNNDNPALATAIYFTDHGGTSATSGFATGKYSGLVIYNV